MWNKLVSVFNTLKGKSNTSNIIVDPNKSLVNVINNVNLKKTNNLDYLVFKYEQFSNKFFNINFKDIEKIKESKIFHIDEVEL